MGPTGTWPDGSPMYTLPAIHDPSTGTSVADSTAIARYLDATYPDTPRVIPEGTEAFREAFEVALAATLAPHVFYLLFPAVYGRLNEASKPHFKAARESLLGGKLEEWSPLGSETREQQSRRAMALGWGPETGPELVSWFRSWLQACSGPEFLVSPVSTT